MYALYCLSYSVTCTQLHIILKTVVNHCTLISAKGHHWLGPASSRYLFMIAIVGIFGSLRCVFIQVRLLRATKQCHADFQTALADWSGTYPKRAGRGRQASSGSAFGLPPTKTLVIELADVPGLHSVVIKTKPLPTRWPLPLLLPHLLPCAL